MASEKSDSTSHQSGASQTHKPKILVLHNAADCSSGSLDAFLENFPLETTFAGSMEQALELLKHQKFDAVLTATADFLPLERASVSEQALTILNTIGEGVCLVAGEGTVLWANAKMDGFSDSVKQAVSQRALQAYQSYVQQLASIADNQDINLRSHKYSFTDEPSKRYFEMIINPMLDDKGSLTQVAAVVWEETAGRRLQKRIDAIDKAGRELVRLEAETLSSHTFEQRINLLQKKIIRYARDLLRFDHFVVRLIDRSNNQLEVLFGVGLPQDTQSEVFVNAEHNGITGYVAATGRSYICNDPKSDPRYLPGLDGVCCSLTVPLLLHDKVIGTLNVESHREQAFTEDDRQMAEIFGRYVAIALNILDLLVLERYQTTGQAADNLSQQVSDPLDGIMTEASLLMEEYIGHDDIRHRLQGIIDYVVKIKSSIRDVQGRPKGIFGVYAGKNIDPDPILAGRNILVVDDEEFIRQTIADVVKKQGCVADTAHDGREAKALLSQRRYDLVISDIKLPHANGYDIFTTARSIDKNIPVILMTGFGYDPNHSVVRANREGLTAVLYKPFKVEQLLGEVRRALEQSKKVDG